MAFVFWFNKVSLAAWVVAGYLITFGLSWPFDLSLIVLLLGTLCLTAANKGESVGALRADTPIALFLATYLICALLSDNISSSFLYGVALIPAVLVYFFVRLFKSNPDYVLVIGALALLIFYETVMILAGLATLEVVDPTPAEVISHGNSLLLVVPNDVIFFALIVPFFMYLVDTQKKRAIQILAFCTIVCVCSLIIYLQSRAALLVLLVAVSTYLLLRFRRVPLTFYMIAVLGLLLIDAAFEFSLVKKVLSFNDSRLPLWNAAWHMFLDKPLVGFGPHTFGEFYGSFFVSDGYAANVVVDNRHTPWPHNLFLELLAEYGIVGFAGFMVVLVQLMARLISGLRNDEGEKRIFTIALTSVVAGFLLAAFIELSLLRLWVVIFVFLLYGFVTFKPGYTCELKKAVVEKRPQKKAQRVSRRHAL